MLHYLKWKSGLIVNNYIESILVIQSCSATKFKCQLPKDAVEMYCYGVTVYSENSLFSLKTFVRNDHGSASLLRPKRLLEEQ